MPVSFPLDFMHLIFENIFKNLILFWSASYKDLDHRDQPYTVERAVWEAIGKATGESGKKIPRAYGPSIPNMNDDGVKLTADMYSFWFQYLGPVFLQRAFKNKVIYKHFIQLITLVSKCLEYSLTGADVDFIRNGFASWVQEYERIYYQYTGERLSACVSTVHALLHIADGIELLGPVWVYWAFAMERFCGRLARLIRSRRFPFSHLDNQVLAISQLTQIKNKFDLHNELCLDPVHVRKSEFRIANDLYEDYALVTPRKRNPYIEPVLFTKLAAALVTRFSKLDAQQQELVDIEWMRQVMRSSMIESWGRLRRLDGGDTMLASQLVSQQADDRRDATYVRFVAWVDANARSRKKKTALQQELCYGRLTHIFHICLPRTPDISITEPTSVALAVIEECLNVKRHPSDLNIYTYSKLKSAQVLDITTVQALVGRVCYDKQWYILDRNGDFARQTFATLDDGAVPQDDEE